jgi:Cu-processing system permease protein
MNRITKFIFLDILRNKIVLFYTLLLAVLSWSVFSLEDNSTKGLLTLLNLVLLSVPLVSVIFSTIYLYNSSEFIELLLSQPVKRSRIWRSLFLGLVSSLALSIIIGIGIPLWIYAPAQTATIVLLSSIFISSVFVSLAFFSSMVTRDKAKGIGIAILMWLFFAVLFDGLVLFLLFQLADYPIEKAMVLVAASNPVDLVRILVLLQMDVSAMMGYTGAVFKSFFGSSNGIVISFGILLLWTIIPFYFSLLKFKKKDL